MKPRIVKYLQKPITSSGSHWGIYNNWQPSPVALTTDPDFAEVLVDALNKWEEAQRAPIIGNSVTIVAGLLR